MCIDNADAGPIRWGGQMHYDLEHLNHHTFTFNPPHLLDDHASEQTLKCQLKICSGLAISPTDPTPADAVLANEAL